MKDLNGPQAMNKGLLKYKVQSVLVWSTTEMRDRRNGLNLDMLSTYGQDGLRLSVFAGEGRLVELEPENHFLH